MNFEILNNKNQDKLYTEWLNRIYCLLLGIINQTKKKAQMKKNPKICLLGDMNVGKTAILQTLINKQFPQKLANTLGACYQKYDIITEQGKTISMDIWDTAGQQKYRSLLSMYYKNCDGIVLVFDVTRPQTFNSMHYWAEQISEHCQHLPAISLVANKVDLKEARKIVPDDKIKGLARQKNWFMAYCSAKQQFNIEYIFGQIGKEAERRLNKKLQRQMAKMSISHQVRPLKKSREAEKDSCC